MKASTVLIDLESVVTDLVVGMKITGNLKPGLDRAIQRYLADGCAIFFVWGPAREPAKRQGLENFLDRAGVKHVFVMAGFPDKWDILISSKAFEFKGTFPV